MAERRNIVKGQIGNAIESVAPDHIATVANQIFDERRQEYQDDINENVGYNEDNPEFVKVYTIKETNQLLWGIQKDGNIYYGAGIPRQIKEYVDFIVSRILNGDEGAPEIDSLNKIINFLDGFSTSETLFEILLELDDKKVDKVEGKSLIDEEYAAGVSYIENPEFKDVKLDATGKIIEANYNDGTKLFGAGVKVNGDTSVNGDASINGELELQGIVSTTIESPEFKVVWTINDRILFGVQTDGNFLFGCGIPRQIENYIERYISDVVFGGKDVTEIIDTLNEITIFLEGFVSGSNLLEYLNDTYGYYEESPEYIRLFLDGNRKIIEAVRVDGTHVFGSGYELGGIITTVIDNPEFLKTYLDEFGHIIWGLQRDGNVFYGAGVPKQIVDYIEEILIPVRERIDTLREDVGEYIDNPEYIKAISDAVGKITEAIRKDGTMVVPAGIETSKANIDGVLTETVSNPEYVEARVDSNGKIYFGARHDGDVIVGGVNINEMKRSLDVDALEVEYDSEDNGIYVTENVDSAIGLEYDSETGDVYQVKDSRITADMTMDETGNVYIEQ